MKKKRLSRPFTILGVMALLACTYANPEFVGCDLPDSITAQLNRVEWCGGMFVAVGAEGTVLLSVDGVRWHSRNVPVNGDLLGVTGRNGSYPRIIVAGKESSQSLLFTIDLSTSAAKWEDLLTDFVGFPKMPLYNITSASAPFNPEFHVAVGSKGTVQCSVDPFLQSPIPEEEIPTDRDLLGVAVIEDGSFFVAAGEKGTIIAGGTKAREHNPIVLLPFPTGTDACFYSVKRIENRYFLCNLNGGACGLAILDSNQNLKPVTMPDSLGVADITHNSAGFFAASHAPGGLILHSSDAVQWMVVDTLSIGTRLRGIASKPGTDTMVVVGHDGVVFRSTQSSKTETLSRRTTPKKPTSAKHKGGLSQTTPHFLIDKKYDGRGRRVPSKLLLNHR